MDRCAGFYLFYQSLEYAFTVLKMERVETSVFADNKEALKLDKFLGYKRIAGKDEMLTKDGIMRKSYRLEVKKEDWIRNKTKLQYILGIED